MIKIGAKNMGLLSLVTLLIVGFIFMSGCVTDQNTPNHNLGISNTNPNTSNTNSSFNNSDASSTSTIPKDNDYQMQKNMAKDIVKANNQLSIDLYNKYKSENGNIFFSPYSIFSALSMTYEGAKGKTAEEMRSVLHLPEDKTKIRSYFKIIYNEINKDNKFYQLNTANALWAQKDYPFKKDYFKLINDYYDGKVTNLDFKTDTENSRMTINNWVEDKTNNKIKNLIPKGILSPQTRLVLTNAIYFKAKWSLQFDAENTSDGNFKLSPNASTTAKMMHQTGYFNYGETDDLQILEMNYLGNDLSMLILLPKENDLNSIEDSINTENLAYWKILMGREKVRVSLPKFKFGTKYFMAEDLKEMGMPSAFNPEFADFSGMYTRQNDNGSNDLYISDVIHKAFIDVTEEGTEAAAATAVTAVATAVPYPTHEEKPKTFKADHPFIFIIQQKKTGNILFMGRVSNPTEE